MLRNVLRVLISNFWVTFIGIISGFIFPKILTINSYASYHTFLLYISYIGILHLGVPSGMFINYAGQDYQLINKEQYKSQIILTLRILALFTILSLIIAFITRNRMIFYVSVAILPICIIASYKSLYQAWGYFKSYSKINTILPTAITLIALGYFLIRRELTADVYIIIYLFAYLSIATFLIIHFVKDTKSIIANKVISWDNWNTMKTGFLLMIGNYVNVLLHSVDKQFITIFYTKNEFAMYSFAMSMTMIINVLISSIAQPLFPMMASNSVKEMDYRSIKGILLCLGSLTGSAYFICSFVIKYFLAKYLESLNIISIFFIAIPAIAVINCLYINLYKLKKQMKCYIISLVHILFISIILNLIAVLIFRSYYAISIATVLTYYIWLIYGSMQFETMKLSLRDIGYLVCFVLTFVIVKQIPDEIIGILCYMLINLGCIGLFYRKDFRYYYLLYRIRIYNRRVAATKIND